MINNGWYKNVILKNFKEIINSATTYIILAFVFLLWNFALGINFEWQQINPFSPPDIFVRSFYSAFVFSTLGLFLYIVHFYKVLHNIVVKIFGLWEIYNFIKATLWLFLMYISYTYLVPWLFNLMNKSVSILFNTANIVLYALPPVGVTLIISVCCLLFKKKLKYKRIGQYD